jgi:tetratricopeptide (TPR) repeat protein
MTRAASAADRALALDPDSAEAHAALAVAHLFGRWDLPRAEAAFLKSIALNPRLATTHAFYTVYLAAAGRPEDALGAARTAESLDPFSPLAVLSVAWACHFAERRDEGLAQIHRLLDIAPGSTTAYAFLASQAGVRGDYPQAISRIETWLRLSNEPVALAERLRAALEAGGEAAFLRMQLDAVDSGLALFGPPSIAAASLLTSLGEHEAALDRLEAGCDAHVSAVVLMGAEPCFKPLRGHPRFRALLQRIGLPQRH